MLVAGTGDTVDTAGADIDGGRHGRVGAGGTVGGMDLTMGIMHPMAMEVMVGTAMDTGVPMAGSRAAWS